MSVIKAEVPKEFKERVQKALERKGISESELVRKSVKNFLDSDEKRESPLKKAGFY